MSEYVTVLRQSGFAQFEPEEVDVDRLLALLEEAVDTRTVSRAIDDVAESRPKDLVEHLEILEEHIDEYEAKQSLSYALGKIGRVNKQAVAVLEERLGAPAGQTRKTTLVALKMTAEEVPEAVQPVVSRIHDRFTDTDSVRYRAAKTYAKVAETDVDLREMLVEDLTSDKPKIRGTAAIALRELIVTDVDDVQPAIQDICNSLTDDEGAVRKDAVNALREISEDSPEKVLIAAEQLRVMLHPETEKSIPYKPTSSLIPLLAAIASEDENVFRGLVEDLLGQRPLDEFGSNDLVELITKILSNSADAHPAIIQEYGPELLDALDDYNFLIQGRVGSALAAAAKTDPEALEFAVDPLLKRLKRGIENEAGARSGTCEALLMLAPTYPRILDTVFKMLGIRHRTIIGKAASLFDSFTDRVDTAIEALDWITRLHPDVVAMDEDAIEGLQEIAREGGEPGETAMKILVRVAYPDTNTVAPLTETLVETYRTGDAADSFIDGLLAVARHDPASILALRESLLETAEGEGFDGDRDTYQLLGILAANDDEILQRLLAVPDEPDDSYGLKKSQSVALALTETARVDPEIIADHFDDLVPLTRSPEAFVRSRIADVFSLVAIDHPQVVANYRKVFLDFVYDPERLIRIPLLFGLGPALADEPDTEIVRRLERVFEVESDRGDVDAACSAATALAFAGDAASIPPRTLAEAIMAYLDEDDRREHPYLSGLGPKKWQFRQAIEALNLLDDTYARSALQRIAADHDDWFARSFASETLGATE